MVANAKSRKASDGWEAIFMAIEARALYAKSEIGVCTRPEMSDTWVDVRTEHSADWNRIHGLAFDAGWATGVRTTRRNPLPCALLGDIAELADAYQAGFYSAVRDDANRPVDRSAPRPSGVIIENAFFWLFRECGALHIGGNGRDGVHGCIRLTRNEYRDVFRAAKQRPGSLASSYLDDPYIMVDDVHELLRDDYDPNEDLDRDEKEYAPCAVNETAGELRLVVSHPASGTLFFGAVSTEATQLRAFQDLQGAVNATYAEEDATGYREHARERAQAIRGRMTVACFLPPSGICNSCETDTTLHFLDMPATGTITGCPVCGRSWCD